MFFSSSDCILCACILHACGSCYPFIELTCLHLCVTVYLPNACLFTDTLFDQRNCICLLSFDRYYRMFEATQDGLGKNAPVHSIHGSLLAVGELLRLA